MKKLYYAEDDITIARSVQEYLYQQDYSTEIFPTIWQTKQALEKNVPDILLVDWNMPDGRGDELCRWVRRRWEKLPIIFLTVRGDARDVVSGFENGADDYVTKPFELEILASRIRALLRRAGQNPKEEEGILRCGQIRLDERKTAVFCGQEEIGLSRPEYGILLILMKNRGRTVTRRQLLEQVWDSEGNFVNDNTLTVTMKRLREKLHNPACLKTIRSFGYRMEDV
ncbi:MAG TPA: response regulator transcription factor [Candidatus Eisenbergiella merdipullorum]|uniref:Stage 0 sporulation protein A homolog n=1 Tax=Candidatus Eisenbergiella merdipullorum TaxID=2838553 RepID=A0A9D2L2R9_9FIRM|nr:response regulator transcription factor [Candidatus Eisenbergiella merdipullorum]